MAPANCCETKSPICSNSGAQTLIAGLTHEALIAPWVSCHWSTIGSSDNGDGAMDGPTFAAYVRQVLIPEIAPGTVIILDSLATHRNREAAAALRAHGCWFLFLPPYSPDLNPIEHNRPLSRTHGVRGLIFSKLKSHLRRIGARTFTAVFDAIGQICDLYDPAECWNYFKAAGYASN